MASKICDKCFLFASFTIGVLCAKVNKDRYLKEDQRMVKCSAPLCGNATYNKTPDITFHRFPKDENMKLAWLTNMRRQDWQPKSSSLLCSKHFETHLINKSGFRTVLAAGVIPTIFDQLQEDEENRRNDEELRKMKHKVFLKNKRIKILQQQNRWLKNKVSNFFEVISSLKEKLNLDKFHIMLGMNIKNKDFFIRYLKKAKRFINVPTSTITSKEQVSQDIKNISSAIPNYDEDNRRKEEDIRKMKHIVILKNKRIKVLKQQNRRLKNKVREYIAQGSGCSPKYF